jgi:TonB family protein
MPIWPIPMLLLRTARARSVTAAKSLRFRWGKSALLLFAMFVSLASPVVAQTPEAQSQPGQSGAVTESELRQMLAGKFLYLRGGYLDDSLAFNTRGELTGNSPRGSYTLSVIHVESVSFSRTRLQLRCVRYGLHFLGAQSAEDFANAADRVRITPRKKWVRITIARMKVVKPPKKRKGASDAPPPQPPDANTTTSAAYAASVLRSAIDTIFASTLDARMMATLPDFWQLYYNPAAAQPGSAPAQVFSVSLVDRKPRLLTQLDAPSNQPAQICGIAGLALYRAVIGPDGTPRQVTVGRPIGFGLDENAVAAIRNARFEPAMKDGKSVPVSLDLVVEFRIYSKRTAAPAPVTSSSATAPLPGPYSVEQR